MEPFLESFVWGVGLVCREAVHSVSVCSLLSPSWGLGQGSLGPPQNTAWPLLGLGDCLCLLLLCSGEESQDVTVTTLPRCPQATGLSLQPTSRDCWVL